MSDFKFKLAFLCFSHTLLHVYTELPLALIPILRNEYELSFFMISLIVSIPRLSSLLFSVPSGLIADRFGATKLISISLSLVLVSGIIILLTDSIELIVLAFSLASIASTLYHPPALSVAANILPQSFLGRGMGFHGASGTLGVALGPLTLGIVLNLFGWKYAYLVWVVPILISVIVSIYVDLRFRSEINIRRNVVEDDGYSHRKPNSSLREVLGGAFLLFLVILLFTSAAGSSISTYITSYFTYERGFDPALASIVFGLSPLMGLISNLAGGIVCDKLGVRYSYMLVLLLLIFSVAGISLSPINSVMVLMYLIYGFSSSMSMPITSSIVARLVNPEYRGTAYSLEFIPMNLVGIFMPVLLSFFISMYGLSIIFLVAFILYCIALTLFLKFNGYLKKGLS
ncbi:MAG: MFS transporter [archaeon GBS-70-058]|nr:MFS transporter [Candidatus Culexarchaeum nevadense]